MTKTILIGLLLLSGCAQSSGITRVGGGMGFINLGNPSVTRMGVVCGAQPYAGRPRRQDR